MSLTLNTVLAGTFSGTGTSTPVFGRSINIALDFAGTASIDIERQMPSGSWVKVQTGITTDIDQVLEYPAKVTVRLNCTAFTNPVEYVVLTGSDG